MTLFPLVSFTALTLSPSPPCSILLPPLLCHLSGLELPRYIKAVSAVFCQKSTLSLPVPLPWWQLTRSLSTEVTATTITNESTTPTAISEQERVVYLHVLDDTLSAKFRLILVAGFHQQEKYIYTSTTQKRCRRWSYSQGILAPLMITLLQSLYIGSVYMLALNACCQQFSIHMLKYKKTLIGCTPVVIVWLQYDQGEVQCQQELL